MAEVPELKLRYKAVPCVVISVLLMTLLSSSASCGDAEVNQTDNLQDMTLDTGDADVTQTDNMQPVKLQGGDAVVIHTNNLLSISLDSNEADVSQTNNLIALKLSSGNADITQNRNLLAFILGPNNAHVTQNHNLLATVLESNNADVTTSSNLVALPLSPNEPLSTSISSFTTTDQNGNPISAFIPGSMVLFKVVIYGSGSQNIIGALVSIMVQDPSLTPIFLSYLYEDIQVAKQTTVYLGFQIPYDCMLGDYTSKVNIFTRLPSLGGEPIVGGHSEVHFTVS